MIASTNKDSSETVSRRAWRDPHTGLDVLMDFAGFDGAEARNRPALVVLNGLLGQNDHWLGCVGALATRYPCVLMQPPLLEMTGSACSVSGVVRMVTGALEQSVAHSGGCVLAGNSLGGHVAIRIAVERPELVRGMVLIGSSGLFERTLEKGVEHRPSRDWLDKKIGDLFYDRASMLPGMVDQAFGELSKRHAARALVKLGRSAKNDHVGEVLSKVRTPTLMAWGRNDAVTPPEVAEEFHAGIAGSKLAWIDRCGHAPQIERPRELATLLSGFLDEIVAGNGAGARVS